jgi:MoxR-like ATPase
MILPTPRAALLAALAAGVLRHRLTLSPAAEIEGRLVEQLVAELVERTEAPR